MIDNFKVSYMQLDLVWEDPDANIAKIEEYIRKLKVKSHLIVLPEMFTTGFSMRSVDLAENMDGQTLQWMAKTAKENRSFITGSLIINENKKYHNRLIWMAPDGAYSYYDKRHLFRMGEEQKSYDPGNSDLVSVAFDWRFKPLICYDLRFPVWSRNRNNYDVLIYVANWPESRRLVWNNLLVARAIENMAYVIGVNRVGKDGRDLSYAGDSVIVDPRGKIVSSIEPYKEGIASFDMAMSHITDLKKSFPVYLDADDFRIL